MKSVAAVVALALAACSAGAPPLVTASDASRTHVQLAELERGRSLLIAKCSNCHMAPLPSQHTAMDWPKKLDEMSARSNLGPVERAYIERYLVAMAR